MLRLLLADDEKWVRATIKSVLPREDQGFTLVGEASNGTEALEKSLELCPDIILTDIRMPEMDGLELIERLKHSTPHIKTIIVSGYDEFEYAQRALQLGAFDYLLKPVEEDSVKDVLSRAKAVIMEEHDRVEKEKLLKVQHEVGVSLLREKFLNDIHKENSFTVEELKEQLKRFGIKLELPVFSVIAVSIDDYFIKIRDMSKSDRQAIIRKFKVLLDRIAKRYLSGYAFSSGSKENEITILCNFEEYSPEFIKRVISNTARITNRRLNITFSAGVSSGGKSINQLYCLYNQSHSILNYKMLNGRGSILFYKNIGLLKEKGFSLSKDVIDNMILNLELLNEKNIYTILDNIFEQASSFKETSPHLLKAGLWDFIVKVVSGMNCTAYPINKLYEFNNCSVYEKFKELETLEEMQDYLKKIFLAIVRNCMSKEKDSNQNVIETAKRYIRNNYNKDITLELISNYVFLNHTYFSELFKKETGQNFIEFITQVRIQEAKKLLKETDLKAYEISEKVGYFDTKYFSKIFKKLVGMTPSEYKYKSKNCCQQQD